ncbi:hypothetical protein AB1283_08440 [Bacillus sp. S13(2024)]|uniref:hypothetical protein n=1 Tax=unclassified Bacillus (in: firmicutes) TaxID=185979 RepID=UPI003D216C82
MLFDLVKKLKQNFERWLKKEQNDKLKDTKKDMNGQDESASENSLVQDKPLDTELTNASDEGNENNVSDSLHAGLAKEQKNINNAQTNRIGNKISATSDRVVALDTTLEDGGIDVTLLGARGDGLSDDRKFIQDAIDYAASLPNGGTIIIPEGKIFLLNSFTDYENKVIIKLKNKVSMVGKGILKIADNFGDYHSVLAQDTTLNDVVFKDFTIDDNTRNNAMVNVPSSSNNNYRIAMFLWGQPSKNITIDNVTVTDCCGAWQFTTGRIEDLSIVNCKVYYTAVVPQIDYDRTSIYYSGIRGIIANNTLNGAPFANTAIEIHGNNTICTGNVITDYNSGMFIVNDLEILQGEDLEGVIVANNTLHNVRTGIMPWFSEKSPVKNLKIVNNVMNLSPTRKGLSSILEGNGIAFHPEWGTTIVSNVEITNNIVSYDYEGDIGSADPSGTKYKGIFVPMYTSNLVFNLENLMIKDNIIINSINSGICIELGNSSTNSFVKGLVLSNNVIKNVGQVEKSNGIELIGIPKYFACIIKNNTIVDDRVSSLMNYGIVYYSRDDVNDDAVNQLQIIDNSIFMTDTNFNSDAINRSLFLEAPCYICMGIYGNSTQRILTTNAKYNSIIEDLEAGRIYRQVDSPSGYRWISESYGKSLPSVGFYSINDVIKSLLPPTSGGAMGWICYQSGVANNNNWKSLSVYKVGDIVNKAGAVYECTISGKSGKNGPSGTSTDIVDGSVHWKFVDWLALFKTYGSIS